MIDIPLDVLRSVPVTFAGCCTSSALVATKSAAQEYQSFGIDWITNAAIIDKRLGGDGRLAVSPCDGRKRSMEWTAQLLRANDDKVMIMVESYDEPGKQGTAQSPRMVQHPAYSGHTAWVMAIMSELAYMRFEDEDLSSLLALPAELGKAMGRPRSTSELQEIEGLLVTRDNRGSRLLRAVLAAGGFELVGVLSDHATDTQGFIAVRRAGDEMDMAVVSFRGTENVQDWMTNLQYSMAPADSLLPAANESAARVHRGFRDAFVSVKDQIDRYLPCVGGLPVFITGHSLGGALATLGTAHLSGWGLAACYTFGAPRVGNRAFIRSWRTPVYRVVNPGDSVPHVPTLLRGYRHAGDRRRLRRTSPSDKVREIWNGLVRLWRLARWQELSLYLVYDTVDRRHNIRVYREKLRDDAGDLG